MNAENYSGRYFRTAWGDIKGSKGWFGKICLLGLISFIPVFGQMTLYGYAYEWAHKAAWGVEGPMPKKIYGRPGSKMLRWGWFALVIAFVISLVPSIVSWIGSGLSAAGSAASFYTASGHYMQMGLGNPLYSGLGWLVNVASIVLFVFSTLFIWAGSMRMTMYDRLSTGLQIGKIWDMVKRDFGGIMRVFGMSLLFVVIGCIIFSIILFTILSIAFAMTIGSIAMLYQDTYFYNDGAIGVYAIGLIMTMLPVFLALFYIALVYNAFVELLTVRAIGYWTRQFNVAAWGTKDDPLPPAPAQQAPQPQPPVAPPTPVVETTPAPPTGEPVIPADAPVVVEEVVETVVTDAEGDVVAAEVDEIDEAEEK